MPNYYQLHGLVVASDCELAALPCSLSELPAHIDITLLPWECNPELFEQLQQTVWTTPEPFLERDYFDDQGIKECSNRVVACENGWLILFFDEVLFHLNIALNQLRRIVRNTHDIALGDALQAGSYWAMHSALIGKTPIHASAIDLPSQGTWLIVAPSGFGKTSTAASLVLAGAALRSDDVVTLVKQSETSWGCESGSLSLRMRQAIPAAEIAASGTLKSTDMSGDERHLYIAQGNIPNTSTVQGICFPVLDDSATQVTITALDRFSGFKQLASDPRVGGILNRHYQHQRVSHLSHLCQSLPLLELRLPFRNRNLSIQGTEIINLLTQYHLSQAQT